MSDRVLRVWPMGEADVDEVVRMRMRLFDDCPEPQQRLELARYEVPAGPPGRVRNQACLVIGDEDGLVGFAEVMLRSHAEGAWEHTAVADVGVAYLEAWWIDPEARGRGAGRALVEACEEWAREQGSPVLASDALLDNHRSQAAHTALGFTEVERSVHYIKKL